MGRIAPFILFAAVVAAAPGGFARAQCRLCGTPTTLGPAPDTADNIRLEIETSINFGRLVQFGEGEGSAMIAPDGARAVAGAITGIGARAMVGTVVIRGEPGRTVRVDLPRQIQLYSLGGGTISFDQVRSDLPDLPRLDGAGQLSFHFGGRIRVLGSAEGDYRGEMPITVEYQ